MGKKKPPVTAAVRILRQHNIDFVEHVFDYKPSGGTNHAARMLGIDEHQIVKTLIMQDEREKPLVVLMHGGYQVSTKQLARTLDVKSINSCDPHVANKHSGYQVGGTSPFGTRQNMPVFIEASILELSAIYINGGKRGYLLEMRSDAFRKAFDALNTALVNVAIAH